MYSLILVIYTCHLPQLTVQCHLKSLAPCGMCRGSATAAADHQFAYFTPASSNTVYRYVWNDELWNELSQCRYSNSALAIIEGELTTVGGERGSNHTNKLLTLRRRQWVEVYPPMETARSHPAAVSTSDGDYIIVIGGGATSWTATVELFQVKTRQWYKLTSLPKSLTRPSATICGNQVHVIGRDAVGYSCSLQALPSSDEPITPQSIPHLISWTPFPPLPVTGSTAATLCGQLVIIGGKRNGSRVNSIHQLVEGQWVVVGSMTSERSHCLVASQSPNKIVIVGGYEDISFASQPLASSVEECTVM